MLTVNCIKETSCTTELLISRPHTNAEKEYSVVENKDIRIVKTTIRLSPTAYVTLLSM